VRAMAAAEARAAWQRAANRCLVQEDAKRAPKLACCPPPVLPHDPLGGNAANLQDLHIPNFMSVNWSLTSSNLPSDTQWWLQLQPYFGCQMTLAQDHLSCIGGEAGEKKTEHLVAPAASKLEDTDAKKVAEPFEPPWIVSTAFTKQTSETGVEQFKTPSGYAPTSLKCRGNTKNYAHEDREFMDFKAFDPLFPMKPQKECCEMNAPWEESKKPQPWWQAADADGLASLVAEKAMHNVVTNDLPRPTQTVQIHGEKLMNHPREKDNYEQPFPSVAQELDPLHDTMVCSYGVSTNSCEGGSWQPRPRNSIPG
jgi:hypothetical protein